MNKACLEILGNGREGIHFSAATAWELSIKARLGKLHLPGPPTQCIPAFMAKQGLLAASGDSSSRRRRLRSPAASSGSLRSPDHRPGNRRTDDHPHRRSCLRKISRGRALVWKMKNRPHGRLFNINGQNLNRRNPKRHSPLPLEPGTARCGFRRRWTAPSTPWDADRSPVRRDGEWCGC